MNDRSKRVWVQYVLLGMLVLLGAYLRLANLRTNPGWYPDEGSDLNIALNLSQGRLQYFAVGGTLLIAARAPLFHLVLVGLFNLFGYDILVARTAAALSGVLTIPLIFWTFKGALGEWKAMSVAAFIAIFPAAVLWNRWAFQYNLLMPLFIICFWALLQLIDTRQVRWMVLAAIGTSLSILTAWVAISLIVCLAVVGWIYNRRTLLWGLPLALSLPIIYLLISYLSAPVAFADDFALTFTRAGGSLLAQFVFAVFNYALFLASNYWLVPGIAGLFLIQVRRVRALVLLFFFTTLFSILRFSPIGELGFHRVLELVPFLALGVTVFLWRAVPFVAQWLIDDLNWLWKHLGIDPRLAWLDRTVKLIAVPIFIYLTIASVLVAALLSDWLNVQSQFATRIDQVLAVPPQDAIAVIDYVNAHAQPSDVVIASPQVGWALNARAVDFQQTLSYAGYPTDNYPTPVERSRFVFDPSPANARFAVVDRMWTVWAVENITSTQILLDDVTQWHVAFRAGDFVVYRNPNR